MLVDIAFFDENVDEDVLRQKIKVNFKVLSKDIIFSRDIRLKKSKGKMYTFCTKDFYSNIYDLCYGMLFKIEVDDNDFEWFDIVLTSSNYKKNMITCSTITCNLAEFSTQNFKVKEHNREVICYTANRSREYISKYGNRHNTVHLCKSLLYQIYIY